MIYSALITGFVWMILGGGLGFAAGVILATYWPARAKVWRSLTGRAAGLRPQTPTGSSQSSIDYRKGEN